MVDVRCSRARAWGLWERAERTASLQLDPVLILAHCQVGSIYSLATVMFDERRFGNLMFDGRRLVAGQSKLGTSRTHDVAADRQWSWGVHVRLLSNELLLSEYRLVPKDSSRAYLLVMNKRVSERLELALCSSCQVEEQVRCGRKLVGMSFRDERRIGWSVQAPGRLEHMTADHLLSDHRW